MNGVNRRASFGWSLVCLLQLAAQFGCTFSQANQKLPAKSPCTIRAGGCPTKLSPASGGKANRPSGYIGGNHYKLTPIDYVDRKLDVYQSRQGLDQNENNKLEHLRSGREPARESLQNRTVDLVQSNTTDRPVAEALYNKPLHFVLPDAPSLNQSFFLNATSSLPLKRANKQLMEDIYGELSECAETVCGESLLRGSLN